MIAWPRESELLAGRPLDILIPAATDQLVLQLDVSGVESDDFSAGGLHLNVGPVGIDRTLAGEDHQIDRCEPGADSQHATRKRAAISVIHMKARISRPASGR